MHYQTIYTWLENNNIWKATVAFWVTFLLGAAVGAVLRPWRAWKHHREAQDMIADRLDTSTPGGLTDLMAALMTVHRALEDDNDLDDNGSDPRKPQVHVPKPSEVTGHGGISATHH